MTVARLMHTARPWHERSEFDLELIDAEVSGGYFQLQLNATRREGFDALTVDWGDGTVDSWTRQSVWHNFTAPGRYRVRIGGEARWWRLWNGATVTEEGRVYTARPRIRPVCWSDTLESCSGTYCGWTNSVHGGVVGTVIPWGRSIKTTFCCYQFCFDLTGPFPEWTDAIEDATGTFDRCVNMAGRIPRWGRNITKVTQCFCDCPGVYGGFPEWPRGCTEFGSCFRNATGMRGTIPQWPETAQDLNSAFEGCTGATGIIPPWPPGVSDVSRCYKDCVNLTGAWTDDPALLMPEEKVRYAPDSDFYRCYDVVTGCADPLRALFWDRNWGGTIPRPE